MYSKILGTGSYFPEKIVTNDDLAQIMDTSDEWITERTGIKQRHFVTEKDTIASMGAAAGRNALLAANCHPKDIDMIVVATTSAENRFPSAACEIQQYLDAEQVPAFDVAAACSGFMYALSIADQFIKTGQCNKILVVGADALSRFCNFEDRTTAVLFGDGAGAILLGADKEQGILSTHLHSDGYYKELLAVKAPIPGDPSSLADAYLTMKGNEVFKTAVNKLSDIVCEAIQANNLTKSDIDWLIPHQANLRIIKATAKKLQLPMERVIVNLDRYGNTSAASVPTALDEGIRSGRIERGQTLLLEAFGGGFAWGSSIIIY